MPISDSSKIGLNNRFEVRMEGAPNGLGSWAKVEGLDVTWDICEYRAGDQGNERYYYPGNTKYQLIRMTRAATAEETGTVKEWLNGNSFRHKPISGSIILKDSFGKEINAWELRRVIPTKWNISTFDSTASSVATETLELTHAGFLDDQLAG